MPRVAYLVRFEKLKYFIILKKRFSLLTTAVADSEAVGLAPDLNVQARASIRFVRTFSDGSNLLRDT
jgi:hypothetical protein